MKSKITKCKVIKEFAGIEQDSIIEVRRDQAEYLVSKGYARIYEEELPLIESKVEVGVEERQDKTEKGLKTRKRK